MDHKAYSSQVIANRRKNGSLVDATGVTAINEATETQFEYLRSGRLLFNDEVGVLLNQIADRVLKDQPEIRKMLSIHAFYSAGTNAMAFPNGFIVMDLGLVAQLENEQQLAFALCHEIAHFIGGDYATQESPFTPDDLTPATQQYLAYLRFRETEADLLAFELFQKAGYSTAEALRYFDVRLRNLPAPLNVPFSSAFLSNRQPQDRISFEAQISDSLIFNYDQSSQLSFSARKAHLVEFLRGTDFSRESIPATKEFQELNALVIYNCAVISLETHEFPTALYLGYYLTLTDSTDHFHSNLIIAKALYQYTSYASKIKYDDSDVPVTADFYFLERFDSLFAFQRDPVHVPDNRGDIKQVALFMESLTVVEQALLSADWSWYCWTTYKRESELLELMCGNSIAVANRDEKISVDSLDSISIYRRSTTIVTTPNTSPAPTLKRPGSTKNEVLPEMNIKVNPTLAPPQTTTSRFVTTKEFLYRTYQLQEESTDTAFRAFYLGHQNFVERRYSRAYPKLLNDSIFFAGSQHIWLREDRKTYTFTLNEQETVRRSNIHRKELLASSSKNGVKLIDSDYQPGEDSLSAEAYNRYSIVSRVVSEISLLDNAQLSIPLAYHYEMENLIKRDSITYAIADYVITRQFSTAPQYFTFRQTYVINLSSGLIVHSWIETDKGIRSPYHYNYIFRSLRD